MIDNAILTKKQLTASEIKTIKDKNDLTEVLTNGKKSYNNYSTSNFTAFKLNITPDQSIKIICSLHKYRNFLETGKQINFNDFPIYEVPGTALSLLNNIGMDENKTFVYGYEIGVNLTLPDNCIEYLNLMESIGDIGINRPFYVNPKYKDERCKTTVFHKDKRKFFKAYDKCFEMADKNRNDIPPGNILRLETTFRRVENMPLVDFYSERNLKKIQHQFFEDWKKVRFKRGIEVPKGTTRTRKDLCLQLVEKGNKTVLETAREELKNGLITEKQFRTIREFIQKDWNALKSKVKLTQTEKEIAFYNELDRKADLLSY